MAPPIEPGDFFQSSKINFRARAAAWRNSPDKARLPEDADRHRVLAEAAFQEKDFLSAAVQAAWSTTSVMSSCCGAPSAKAWAAARIRLMACRAGRP